MHTIAERGDHVDRHTENMGVREYADVIFTPAERNVSREEIYVHAEVLVQQHYAFWISGGAGSIHYCSNILESNR